MLLSSAILLSNAKGFKCLFHNSTKFKKPSSLNASIQMAEASLAPPSSSAVLAIIRSQHPKFKSPLDCAAFAVHATLLVADWHRILLLLARESSTALAEASSGSADSSSSAADVSLRLVAVGAEAARQSAEAGSLAAAGPGSESDGIDICGWNDMEAGTYSFLYALEAAPGSAYAAHADVVPAQPIGMLLVSCVSLGDDVIMVDDVLQSATSTAPSPQVQAKAAAAEGRETSLPKGHHPQSFPTKTAQAEIRVNDFVAGVFPGSFARCYKDLDGLVAAIHDNVILPLAGGALSSKHGQAAEGRQAAAAGAGDGGQREGTGGIGAAGGGRSEPRGRESGSVPPPSGVFIPPLPSFPADDLHPGGAAGVLPSFPGGVVGGPSGMFLGPNDPLWGAIGGGPSRPPLNPPGLPPGARFDPYGPPGIPGFEPGRFGDGRPSQPPPHLPHPDLQNFRTDDF